MVTCPQCGANAAGPMCEYCGTLLDPVDDLTGERSALNRLHEYLNLADKPRQMQLLRHGYLPASCEVLIDAGMRLIPLCNLGGPDIEPRDSAIARLETIISKLRILHSDPESIRAIEQFERIVRSNKRSDMVWMVVALLLFVGLPLGGLWWWLA